MASGTVQPDVRSMWHALKGTGYSLDVDHSKMTEIENLLNDGLKEYDFDPVTTTADARVVGFPMPGGAIGPNVHMMKEAGILGKYSEVLAEFPVVVKAGGAWTSVTPGSQQYWLQAFNNVLLGRWKKINDGYGKAVLGYFGRPPLEPDADVVKVAAEQLGKDPFHGDPLEAAPDSLATAEAAIKERNLPVTEENVFLVAAATVPGKNMDLNEGIRLLTGKPKISLPLKKKEEEAKPKVEAAPAPAPQPATGVAPPPFNGPLTTQCTVVEGTTTRRFSITIEPPARSGAAIGVAEPQAATAMAPAPKAPGAGQPAGGIPVYSPFEGKVEVVEINVKVGDMVTTGQVVAAVEAMKAKHDVKAPSSGRVVSINAEIGSDVKAGMPILTLGG
jgi:pyruvate carboxylase subunit B